MPQNRDHDLSGYPPPACSCVGDSCVHVGGHGGPPGGDRPPLAKRDHPRWNHGKAAKQGTDLGMGAWDQGDVDQRVVSLHADRHGAGCEIAGQMLDHHEAAWRQLPGQGCDDRRRIVCVSDEMQHCQ